MASLDDYTGLITSQHADKPKFKAVVEAVTQGLVDNINLCAALTEHFNLDTAVGVQLDAVGLWVGASRRLKLPLEVYFEWDGSVILGWDSGSWQGEFDPVTGLVLLPDDAFRRLIRSKIAANNWDGTIPGAIAVWDIAFDGGQTIIIQDNQDMSMVVGFVGPALSAIDQALLTGGYTPLKPAGVRIAYYAIPSGPGPLLGWDSNSDELRGWDFGQWAQILLPL